ncbi:MAG: polyribonucleotide nucleotidyltransferase, partial [Dehalococcoidia bacterium]|nr:polyribonucleotide nucleotidyltransferase [Dehalococcoidia bacterium]
MSQSVECTIGDRLLTIETGKLAGQADSAVTVRYGDTIVLVTACISDEPREGRDFVQLTVDYEERHYSVGKIPGSFIRRESRPSEHATLTCRLTDRSIRPLFYKSVHNEIQVVATVLSVDQENGPDILAVIGASAALTLSSIPFDGPISAVRIGYIDDNLVLNPTWPQMNDSLLDLVVASTGEAVIMLEAGGKEVSDEIVLQAIEFGHEANQEIIKIQEGLRQACGQPKMEVETVEIDPKLLAAVSSDFGDKLTQAVSQADRAEREKAVASVEQEA